MVSHLFENDHEVKYYNELWTEWAHNTKFDSVVFTSAEEGAWHFFDLKIEREVLVVCCNSIEFWKTRIHSADYHIGVHQRSLCWAG